MCSGYTSVLDIFAEELNLQQTTYTLLTTDSTPQPPRLHSQFSHSLITFTITMGSQADDGPLGKEFTRTVIESMGPKTSPRMREVMSSLITHLHEFATEVQLTTDEWMAGVQMINWAGQMSDEKRNEGQLLCDVLGIES